MITDRHLQEWLDSGVDPDIINLNVRSRRGTEFHLDLFYSSKIPRRNTGELSVTYHKKYRPLERGGFWVGGGRDPLNNWEEMRWGNLKGDTPRIGQDGKKVKYEPPPKTNARAFFLLATLDIWQRVSERSGIAMPEDISIDPETGEAIGFWRWVWENSVPITIVEGVKKAGCLLSQGIAAIGVPGINGAVRTRDQGNPVAPYLIPEIKHFATLGRQVDICFDQDSKPKTRRAVAREIDKLGHLLRKEGCEVRVISWHPELGKGVDDFIVSQGAEAFQAVLDNHLPLYSHQKAVPGSTVPFQTWLGGRYSQLNYKPSVVVKVRYLDLDIPGDHKLVCIKSAKGTGKTQSLEELVKDAQETGKPVLLITHRVQLGQELANRLGLPYVTELSECEYGKLFGYGLCVDSLHSESQARFNPEDWDDCIVILDECEQVIWHLLNSSTEVRKHRSKITDNLATLLKNVLNSEFGQVILLDADLSDLSIDFVKGLAEKPDLDPYIILNEWKPSEELAWKVNNYRHKGPEDWYAALIQAIARGERPLIHLSAQQAKSKWGTKVIEQYLRQIFPHLRILRIDAETVADPTHEAYGCIDHLNEVLLNYDIVIASPVIETGVSITLKGHFTSVWVCSQGVQPENAVRQAMSRLREPVDRHIWAAPRGMNKIGNGVTSARSIAASQNQICKLNISLLDNETFYDLRIDPNHTAKWTWAQMAARQNLGMVRYRDAIMESLTAEGHHIIDIEDGLDPDEKKTLKQEVTATRDEVWCEESEAIAQTELISSHEYEKIKKKKAKKPDERRAERRYELDRRYSGVPLTTALVMDDDQGLYPKLLLHYYFTWGNPFLKRRENKVTETQSKEGNGSAVSYDLNRVLLSTPVRFLEILGVHNLLNPNREFRGTDADLIKMESLAKRTKNDIKKGLGITIKDTDSPMLIAQKLLTKLGLKLTCVKREGSDGKRCRVYKFILVTPPCIDFRGDLFAAWYERDCRSFEIAA